MTDLTYSVVPQANAYNVGVFLLNFNSRPYSERSLKEAFEKDFDITLPFGLNTDQEVLKAIMEQPSRRFD
jgi:hypothetical protein